MFPWRILLVAFLSVTLIQGTVKKFSLESSKAIEHPSIRDFNVYLNSLIRLVKFCSTNKYDLDMNFVFGLFLVNVNLKFAVKHRHLPESNYKNVLMILKENDELLEFFDTMVRHDGDTRDRSNKMIVSLFSNQTSWMERLKGFTYSRNEWDIQKMPYLFDYRVSLTKYIARVDDFDSWFPSPQLSDMCMVSLAHNPEYDSDGPHKCSLHERCYDVLMNGTDFGYALTHRLLLLINAKYGRGCAVFSQRQDTKLRRELCNIAYNESNFIAIHNYAIVDLILEMITLCGMDSHVQFLRRDWMKQILKYQSAYGCFSVTVPKSEFNLASSPRASETWTLAKHRDHQILGGLCNGHVTSVAAGALSVAIRYIIDTYFKVKL